jgi:hypothetical protein
MFVIGKMCLYLFIILFTVPRADSYFLKSEMIKVARFESRIFRF